LIVEHWQLIGKLQIDQFSRETFIDQRSTIMCHFAEAAPLAFAVRIDALIILASSMVSCRMTRDCSRFSANTFAEILNHTAVSFSSL
jgi:hypothetical protein